MAAGVGVIGLEAQGLAEGGGRLGELTLAPQGDAKVGAGVRQLGVEAQGLAAMPLGLDQQAGREVDGAEVTVEDRVRAVQGQGLVDEVDGLAVVAGLVERYAQEVQGVRVSRGLLQDAPVKGLGLAEAPRLVVPNGQRQALGDREHGG
jgi:hypothetical protein